MEVTHFWCIWQESTFLSRILRVKTPADQLLIGAHTSAAGGVHNALLEGKKIGATTIQLFTSNQRQWKGKPIPDEEVVLWKEALNETGLKKIMSHDSYLINLGSPDPELLQKSQETFAQELKRCHQLEIAFLNFHPGTNTSGDDPQKCLDQIIDSVRKMEKLCQEGHTRLLIEATAGQGKTLGHTFEQLGYLLDKLHGHVPVGICIDTCHIFSAGYDIRTQSAWEKTLEEFERFIGLKHLYAFHLNDSKHPLASKKDRHEQLGKGEIGLAGFEYIMHHPVLREIPKYLETPDPELWEKEIKLLREMAK